ncbi:MAG: DUF3877 family protein [Candidatus Methanomethylophilaceae archaeon]|nr:DUF3877 family protein [Candidatus Methanomethylophilaceae archaeon]
MDGKELYQRVVDTVQEMHLKIGDSEGSISLYYPYDGEISEISEDFSACCRGLPAPITLERIPERIRVIVPEADCRHFSSLPVRETLKDIVELMNSRCSMDEFRNALMRKHPYASFRESDTFEFDWILTFPEDIDADVYCVNDEMGTVTYHRFSREDFLAMDFRL